MTEEIYGLTGSQHSELGSLALAAKQQRRGKMAANDGNGQPELLRVVATEEPVYRPAGTQHEVIVFEYDETDRVQTLYMTGTGLRGNLVLTINGVELAPIDARATQDELRAHCKAELPKHTVSVWLGIWEFDGRDIDDKAEIEIKPEEAPEEPPPDFVSFDGGLQLVDEYWVSARLETNDRHNPEYVKDVLTDALPYTDGTVAEGAIGLCKWHDEAGWIPIAWQCRDISFHTDQEAT